MPSPAARRVAPVVAATLAGSALLLVAGAPPAAAHSVEGGELPAPSWLLAYGLAFAPLAAAVVVRSTWTRARGVAGSELARGDAAAEVRADGPSAGITGRLSPGHVAGSVLLLAVLVAAIAGPDEPAFNVAPRAVLIGWWILLPVAALLLGDVVRRIDPFVAPAALVERATTAARPRRAVATAAPGWTAAALLGAFWWFFLAYHSPGSPSALAVLLLAYTAAAVAGAAVWGRGWLAAGEGFAGVSAAVARLSWRATDRRPLPGLAALMVVWLGGTAFDGVASTAWWADVVGTSQGWTATVVSTLGLVWVTALVGGAYLALAWVAARLSVDGLPRGALGLVLVPLALSWFVSHDLTLFLGEGQNLLVLLSDPLGRGWDLLGTGDLSIDFTIVEQAWVGWAQVLVLVAGHVAAVVVGHDTALQLIRPRAAAVRATWAVAGLAAVSGVAAALLVLA